MKKTRSRKRKALRREPRLVGWMSLTREFQKYRAVTYLAGPMSSAHWSGAGWRTRLSNILLKRFNIFAQDPVRSENRKTGLRPARAKKLLKHLIGLIIRYQDKDAELKFMKIMRRMVNLDLRMVARSHFMVTQVVEGIVSIGTTTEMIDGARMLFWREKFMPRRRRPIYILYTGRPENFPAWQLFFVVLSGGRVFEVTKKNGCKNFLNYLQRRYDLETEEKNGKHKKSGAK